MRDRYGLIRPLTKAQKERLVKDIGAYTNHPLFGVGTGNFESKVSWPPPNAVMGRDNIGRNQHDCWYIDLEIWTGKEREGY